MQIRLLSQELRQRRALLACRNAADCFVYPKRIGTALGNIFPNSVCRNTGKVPSCQQIGGDCFLPTCFAVHAKKPAGMAGFFCSCAVDSLRCFGMVFLRIFGGRLRQGKRQYLRIVPSSRKKRAGGRGGGLGEGEPPLALAEGGPLPQMEKHFTSSQTPSQRGGPCA